MLTASNPHFRRFLAAAATFTWTVAVTLAAVEVATENVWVGGRAPMLLDLSIAITSTIVFFVGRAHVPIDIAFKVGYETGFSDAERKAKPAATVVEIRDRLVDH